ncbi:PCI-domain-containing protein [Suillus spraguei]|nr:PCI-domain-containing protein [Suillus spraguei]
MAKEIILISNLSLPQHLFTLISPTLGKQLLEGLVTSAGALTSDPALLESMEKDNEEELRKLDERLAEVERQEGESEISDTLKAELEGTVAVQKLALENTPGLASRVDIALTLIRLGFFFSNNGLITENLLKTERFIEEGGGWDRRNRLKVYRGLRMASICHLKAGGALLLDALSTFTAAELTAYNGFVALTIIINSLTLKRVDLKTRLITAPEVISVLPEILIIGDLLNNLYDCHYAKFIVALKMQILAYSQLLESYCSLTLESLSGAFSVSIEFVDSELSRFIANGRLHCTIDKVCSIAETTRPSLKNVQYNKVIKQGDVLLNSIQRLSKAFLTASDSFGDSQASNNSTTTGKNHQIGIFQ